jgi:hypothetical protein
MIPSSAAACPRRMRVGDPGALPLPACGERRTAGALTPREIVLATHLCVRALPPRRGTTTLDSLRATKGRRSADRRIQPWPCRCAARQRALRSPLASRRSTAALAPASERQDSAQAALHASGRSGRYPRHRSRFKRSTSRAGPNAGGVDTQAARERGHKPRPQEPHSLHQLAVTGRRP